MEHERKQLAGQLSSLSASGNGYLLRLKCNDLTPPPYGDRLSQTPVPFEGLFDRRFHTFDDLIAEFALVLCHTLSLDLLPDILHVHLYFPTHLLLRYKDRLGSGVVESEPAVRKREVQIP